MDPIAIVTAVLADPTNLEHLRPLVAHDVTYVSLKGDHLDLHRLMPWSGTKYGVENLAEMFAEVKNCWGLEAYDLGDVFAAGERVAVFGRFTYTSAVFGEKVTTPMAIFSKVVNGKLTYMQFM